MRSQILIQAVVSFVCIVSGAPYIERRISNGVGRTPALGWNSWNAFGCSGASASSALTAANQLVNLGLKQLGYEYVNIDDCWSQQQRNGSGYLVPDLTKWPNGIPAVVDKIHGMGLKFGLYGDAGTKTCAGHPGSQGHEQQDADLLGSWGVDYWKYDNCYTACNGENPVPQTCWIPRDSEAWYTTFGNYLKAVSHPILYSLCSWGLDNVWTWGGSVGNSWRMHSDISNEWSSIVAIASTAAGISQYAGPGGFNDLDMMEIGNGGLTEAEERAHFGIWAIAKSPIILGTNLASIPSSSLAIIKNADILSINQDSLGKAASYFVPSGASPPVSGRLYPYWAGPLSDGVVIGIVAADDAGSFNVKFADVPGLEQGTYGWKELYSGTSGSGTGISVTLGTHDMAIYKVTKSGTAPATTTSAPTGMPAGVAQRYGQCGGSGWTGPTTCVSPYTCQVSNEWYSQCL
ncbi:alpha-galactosidase [Xylogone sp. PMI_703]|nr:alpha-galactosidase [Xylogone sp. PMI_703]